MPNLSSPEHRLFFCMNIIYAKRMNSLSVQTQYWIMAISIIVFAITIITAVLAYKAGKKHGFLDAQVSENERMEHARKECDKNDQEPFFPVKFRSNLRHGSPIFRSILPTQGLLASL